MKEIPGLFVKINTLRYAFGALRERYQTTSKRMIEKFLMYKYTPLQTSPL